MGLSILHLLAAPPDTPSNQAFWKDTREGLSSGGSLSAYFLHEGASALLDPRLPKLVAQGLRLFGCPRAVESYAPSHSAEIVLGGPGLLAELIERCKASRSYNPR
ncbi:MAG: hypothetical protein EBQ51_03035 [Verrucomicrobia bacterium]|nr:hypothetical protein [Pseudomonadota bacterium]NBS06988.1 hypothetical protein [Verrucomicrobiota bacterium]NBS79509.1 hypothetical protein [bacterium]NBS50286.1 hypothetical protein [Verrucomicrobiota bacterium]NBT23560.1 hypothetical protein [bacterium]